ncbi:hypothetical protein MMC30_006684 [Trapelia coarctata]|nr:hypothetical protein [Trapelia coarctata]
MSWSDWNSSTDLRSQLVSAQVEDSIQDEFLDFSSIMSAMKGNNLPEIIPVNLEFDGLLGNGSNFNVNRSILRGEGQTSYFVAVKHLRVEDRSRDHIQSLYKGLMREIRVLTHPSTRDHDNIVPLLAWGWTDQPLSGLRRPFLVMEYSDFGSLRNYLDGRRLPKAQRHTLALNVASGLQALHSSKIIHGDIKLENVLVYDAGNDHPRIAKLADFGSALFEHSWTDGSEYYGTRKYNAPEVEGRSGKQVQQKINGQISIGSCYKADVYSLGLCVWEVMAHGQDFIDVAWVLDHPDRGSFLQEEGILLRPETTTPKGIKAQLEYLDKVCETEADGMLTRALSYCRNMASFRDRDKEIIDSVDESLRSTLKDDARERSGINEVVKSLAKGTE